MYLTPKQEKRLRRDLWFIIPKDKKTKQLLMEKILEATGQEAVRSCAATLAGYATVFEIVKFFAEHREKFGLEFISFHRDPSGKWQEWSEGKRTRGLATTRAFRGEIPHSAPYYTRYQRRKREQKTEKMR